MILALLVSMGAAPQEAAPAPAPPPVEEIEARALACGLTLQNLKPLEGDTEKSHWSVVAAPDGTLPDFNAFDCFLKWAGTQKGLRIGFVSEPKQ